MSDSDNTGAAPAAAETTLARGAGVWYLTGVERSEVYPKNPERFAVSISDRAADNLVKRTLKAFGRTLEAVHQQAA